MLAKDILNNARFILSDTRKERWTDARLLALLNDCIVDIAAKTVIFVENVIVQLNDLVVDIDLSSVATKIVRAEYLDEPVDFYSFDAMDEKFGKTWQKTRGDKLQALVYDKQKNSLLKTYPIIENAVNTNISYNSLFGIVTDISYSDIQPVMFNHYGDISGIPNEALVKIYYVRKHAKVLDINETVHIDDICFEPICHYIAGRALRDNQDDQNRAMGNEELNFYYSMIKEYSNEKTKDYVRAKVATSYRPMG